MQNNQRRETNFGKALWYGLIIISVLLFLGLLLVWGMQEAGAKAQSQSIDEYPEWLAALEIEFGEGVEVLAGELQYSRIRRGIESFGDVSVDYFNYTLTLADGTVVDLPHGEAYSGILQALRLEEGLLWFSAHSESEFYMIDLATGTMSRRETVSSPCGEQRYYLWTWVVYEQDGQDYLCELATGELIGPFAFASPDAGLEAGRISVSPSENIVALNVGGMEDAAILLVDMEKREWKLVTGLWLGLAWQNSVGWSVQWVNDDYLLIENVNVARGGFNFAQTEVIDVKNAELIHHFRGDGEGEIASNTAPTLMENPLRIETRFETYTDWGEVTNCTLEILYLESRELEQHDFGRLCHLVAGDWNGIGYFISTTAALDASTIFRREEYRDRERALVRHDASTGQNEVIYAGAILDLAAISPDENYALMRLSYEDGVSHSGPETEAARFVLMDLRTEEILYESVSLRSTYMESSWESNEMLQLSLSNHSWSQAIPYEDSFLLMAIDDNNEITSLRSDAVRIQGLGDDWYAITTTSQESRFDLQVLNAYSQMGEALMSFSNQQYPFNVNASYSGENRFTVRFNGTGDFYEQSYIFTLGIRD